MKVSFDNNKNPLQNHKSVKETDAHLESSANVLYA